MAIQFEIVLWKSHPKWVVDCGQHMEVKCSPPERKTKSSRSPRDREENEVGAFQVKVIMTVPN